MQLILASTSPYRKSQLSKFGIPFLCEKPEVNEETLKTELLNHKISPLRIAVQLSEAKARSVAMKYSSASDRLIISGDQLVEFESEILGKPLNSENARRQLHKLNSKSHKLITCISLLKADQVLTHTEIAELKMNRLSENEIDRYLNIDSPYDCAGSYKIESYGIALFESIKTADFTSIQGLPMLWLAQKLREYQYEFFRS